MVAAIIHRYDAEATSSSKTSVTWKTRDTGFCVSYEDPFGDILVADDSDGSGVVDENPFRFSTKYHDDETGLVYYGFRYYSPGLGRWMSRDPGKEAASLNLFAFVANQPVSLSDGLGDEIAVTKTAADMLDNLHIDYQVTFEWDGIRYWPDQWRPSVSKSRLVQVIHCTSFCSVKADDGSDVLTLLKDEYFMDQLVWRQRRSFVPPDTHTHQAIEGELKEPVSYYGRHCEFDIFFLSWKTRVPKYLNFELPDGNVNEKKITKGQYKWLRQSMSPVGDFKKYFSEYYYLDWGYGIGIYPMPFYHWERQLTPYRIRKGLYTIQYPCVEERIRYTNRDKTKIYDSAVDGPK